MRLVGVGGGQAERRRGGVGPPGRGVRSQAGRRGDRRLVAEEGVGGGGTRPDVGGRVLGAYLVVVEGVVREGRVGVGVRAAAVTRRRDVARDQLVLRRVGRAVGPGRPAVDAVGSDGRVVGRGRPGQLDGGRRCRPRSARPARWAAPWSALVVSPTANSVSASGTAKWVTFANAGIDRRDSRERLAVDVHVDVPADVHRVVAGIGDGHPETEAAGERRRRDDAAGAVGRSSDLRLVERERVALRAAIGRRRVDLGARQASGVDGTRRCGSTRPSSSCRAR